MKRLMMIAACALCTVLLAGCGDKEKEEEKPVEVSLEVTDIADNCATIKAALTSGNFYGAKLVESMSVDDVTVDTSNDIQLIKFMETYGVDVTLPLEKTITGVRIGTDRFTAIVVYDATGRATQVKTVTWTPEGLADGWSQENSAGTLEEIKW